MSDIELWRNELRAICTRSFDNDEQGAVVPAIRRATTYRFTEESLARYSSGHGRDTWLYSRYGNPTVRSLEHKLAAMSQSEDALACGSGMAAISATLIALANAGDRWLVSSELYGVTYALLMQDIARFGVVIEQFNPRDVSAFRHLCVTGKPPAVVYCETLSNPLVRSSALPDVISVARGVNAKVVVDNTFATPWNISPVRLGATFSIESGTKYLNGHSDVLCGMVAGSGGELLPVWRQLTRLGGALDPAAAYLWDRGLRTFPLRIEAASATAEALAGFLIKHPEIEAVFYPGVSEERPAWLPGAAAVLAFRVAGGDERAKCFMSHLRQITPATSLGGVESLISLPYNTSHIQFTSEQRAAIGILPGTVRLAVGLESSTDLIEDIHQALIASKEKA